MNRMEASGACLGSAANLRGSQGWFSTRQRKIPIQRRSARCQTKPIHNKIFLKQIALNLAPPLNLQKRSSSLLIRHSPNHYSLTTSAQLRPICRIQTYLQRPGSQRIFRTICRICLAWDRISKICSAQTIWGALVSGPTTFHRRFSYDAIPAALCPTGSMADADDHRVGLGGHVQ